MIRPRPGTRSTATATTLCQKCLKRGHYSFECSMARQDRPYTARPSRTQQLLNPKLAPKLAEVTPPVTVFEDKKSSKAQDSPAKPRERSRSASSYSSDYSVSTISTNASHSRSPTRSDSRRSRSPYYRHRSRSPVASYDQATRRGSRTEGLRSSPRGRRSPRRSVAAGRERSTSCDSRERKQRREQWRASHRSRSRSPVRSRYYDDGDNDDNGRQHTHRRSRSRSRSMRERPGGRGDANDRGRRRLSSPPPRPRSLSPYSKRAALGQDVRRRR